MDQRVVGAVHIDSVLQIAIWLAIKERLPLSGPDFESGIEEIARRLESEEGIIVVGRRSK